MPIGRRYGVGSFTCNQLVIVDASNEVFGSHSFMILRYVDRSGDFHHVLNQYWCNGYDPLKRNATSFELIVLLAIACYRWEIRIEIGIAQTPSWRDIKPVVRRRKWKNMTSRFKRSIEQVNIGNMGISLAPIGKCNDAIVTDETSAWPQFSRVQHFNKIIGWFTDAQ